MIGLMVGTSVALLVVIKVIFSGNFLSASIFLHTSIIALGIILKHFYIDLCIFLPSATYCYYNLKGHITVLDPLVFFFCSSH